MNENEIWKPVVNLIEVKANYLTRDVEELSNDVGILYDSIDEIRKAMWILQLQSSLDEKVWMLQEIRKEIEEEVVSTKQMVQALQRVQETYIKSEASIVNNAEEVRYILPRPEIGKVVPMNTDLGVIGKSVL